MARKRDIEGNRLHHFELSDKNRTVRWILIAVLLVVGAVALATGLLKALETPAGWQTVTPLTAKLTCADRFVLHYEYGAQEQSATAESKALERLYGEATEKAWNLFYNEAGASEISGLYALNQQPNTEITVDSALYAALAQLKENGTRALYLGPVYAAYDQVFYSIDATEAENSDPTKVPELREYVQTLANFANDPESVELELHGNDQVKLSVSEAYLAFAKENDVQYLLDLGWLKNAFAIDFMAQTLIKGGFTNGYLSSVDGFTRNLDQRNTAYNFNLFDSGKRAGVMQYHGGLSIAFLRSYPMHQEDSVRYYTFADGRIVTTMIDPGDGQSKASAQQLVSYSQETGCAELAMSMLPLYVTEDFDEGLINELTEKKIYSIWFEGKELHHNQKDLSVTTEAAYTAVFAN